jgi:hypothetical protein
MSMYDQPSTKLEKIHMMPVPESWLKRVSQLLGGDWVLVPADTDMTKLCSKKKKSKSRSRKGKTK